MIVAQMQKSGDHMKEIEECALGTESAGSVVDPARYGLYERIFSSVVIGILFSLAGVCVCGYVSAYAQQALGEFGDTIYGSYFPFTPFFTMLCYFTILGAAGLLANFRLGKPPRFVREVIAWLVLFYAAFGLHCLAAYLFYGDGMALRAVVRGFCIRSVTFSGIVIVAVFMAICFWCFWLIEGWRLKRILSKQMKRGKPVKTLLFFQKFERFVERNPTLVVKSMREYFCRYVRYAIFGAVLSLLFLEAMIVFCFALDTQSLWKRADHGEDSVFELVSFEGERFGRVMPEDVVRKKLDQPIGVIDELMLQTEGNPARRLVCMYGQKYLGDISAEEANGLAEETCTALGKLIGVEFESVPLSGRNGFRKGVFSNRAYAQVKWDDHFFQREKVLRLEVGLNEKPWHDSWLKVSEVMGYKIGEPISGDGKPITPFWKFERVVNQASRNQICDGLHAVHDVSGLNFEDAVKELEDARRAVEELHGISMFKMVDGDDVKQYEYYGNDVLISVKLEYRREKQIRYGVLAKGNWARQIHAMPSAGRTAQKTVFYPPDGADNS